MEQVMIIGAGMTPFKRDPGVGVRALATVAIDRALEDAGVQPRVVEKIFMGNAVAGVVSHQEMIRGQVALRNTELAGIPLVNVENACASGGTAFQLGWETIAAGRAEVVLVVGAEQLTHEDKDRTWAALRGSTDIEEIGEPEPGDVNSILMEFYAEEARSYLEDYDATAVDLALVAVKNRRNGGHNPLAQYRAEQTVEEVLAGRMIVPPLTLPMCSPVTDGGAALVLCSAEYARRAGDGAVEVLASELVAGRGRGSEPVAQAAGAVYRATGLGPDDLDLVELHDAAAPAELIQYAQIGLCEEGEGHHLLRRGETEIGGRLPANTSGGLLSRGHPLGATGCAQLVELCTQLRGRAEGRQVEGAKIAMAINAGGWLGGEYASTVATIVRAVD